MKFDREIKEYLEMLEEYTNKNDFTKRAITEGKEALENEKLQERYVKHIIKELLFKLRARNKALGVARREVKILKSQLGEEI